MKCWKSDAGAMGVIISILPNWKIIDFVHFEVVCFYLCLEANACII